MQKIMEPVSCVIKMDYSTECDHTERDLKTEDF